MFSKFKWTKNYSCNVYHVLDYDISERVSYFTYLYVIILKYNIEIESVIKIRGTGVGFSWRALLNLREKN